MTFSAASSQQATDENHGTTAGYDSELTCKQRESRELSDRLLMNGRLSTEDRVTQSRNVGLLKYQPSTSACLISVSRRDIRQTGISNETSDINRQSFGTRFAIGPDRTVTPSHFQIRRT